MMATIETQQRQHQRDAVAAQQTEARSATGRIIIQLFLNTNNLWATSAQIIDACSEYDKVLVRNRVQHFVTNGTLVADKSGGLRNYKYRLRDVSLHQRNTDFVGPMQLAPAEPAEPEPCVVLTTPVAQQVPEGVTGRKSKVVWSHDERLTLAHEVATIRKAQPFVSLGGALDMAQIACLPKERHRIPIGNIKVNATWLADMVDIVAANMPVPAEPKPAAPAVTAADFSVGQLIDVLLDKLSDRFKGGVMEILKSPEVHSMLRIATNEPQVVRRHNPAPAPLEATVKKERILIAGILKPMHVEEVKEKFGKDFDLRFFHPDESVHKLKSMAPNADRVILMVTQISHKHEDSLKTTNIKYEKVRGNIGVLISKLTELKSNSVH